MKYKNLQKIKKDNYGFVILYAIMISSMVLAITLGVASIALKEIKFSTSAKDTNDAFFAADVGAECALYYDKNKTISDPFPNEVTCAGNTNISVTSGSFTLINLGNNGQSCVKVIVDKTDPVLTKIVSKGYNDGGSVASSCTQGVNSVERRLELNY